MEVSIRFSRKYKTPPGTYWRIIYWRENKLPARDIRVLLIRRGIKISESATRRWVKKADKILKKEPTPKPEVKADKNDWVKW